MTAKDSDAVLAEYRKLAPQYDHRWAFYIRATRDETLERFEVKPHDRVLDVGCGTGALLASILDAVPDAQLTGVDPSAEMLEVARDRLDSRVKLRECFADGLPFDDAAFDWVISTNSFHYFRNPAGALDEMARVLVPGGRVVITDWCDDYLTCALLDIVLSKFNRAHYQTYGKAQCRALLEQAGFTVECIDRYKINWFWGLMTAVAHKREKESTPS